MIISSRTLLREVTRKLRRSSGGDREELIAKLKAIVAEFEADDATQAPTPDPDPTGGDGDGDGSGEPEAPDKDPAPTGGEGDESGKPEGE